MDSSCLLATGLGLALLLAAFATAACYAVSRGQGTPRPSDEQVRVAVEREEWIPDV